MSKAVVEQAKADLIAAYGEAALQGDNGGFLIVMEAAYRLGLGVVDKPNGAHAEYPVGSGHFYSKDGVMTRNGDFFDVLVDAGDANGPAWQPNGTVEPLRYRPAVSTLPQGGIQQPPETLPPPAVEPAPLAWLEARLEALRVQADANTEKIQRQIDQVVKNAEKSVREAIPQLLALQATQATGGFLSGLFGRR